MEQYKKIRIEDFITIVKRRRMGFIVSSLAVFLCSVLVVLLLEPVYRSTATILIEEQEIPREYVMATVTSYAEQRLQAINQRIMSSSRLLDIIKQFDLYAEKRKGLTNEEIIDDMRTKDIQFKTITADVVNRRTGQPTEATIAFAVSYEGKSPLVVQQIANVLASLYLEENIKVTGQQSSAATKFLEDEMKSVQVDLEALERKISVYKEKNAYALPELLHFNLQTLDWSERNYDQLKDQFRSLREKESYLKTQLATMAPDVLNQDKDQLRQLRVALVGLRARYSDEYPDVIKVRAEIAELEKKLQAMGGQQETPEKPDNPAYIGLSSELASIQSEIKSYEQQIKALDEKRNLYRQRLQQYPKVDEGYKNLMVERNNTQAKYDDLMKKFMDAKVAHGLEKEQMGERFTLIEPPRLPEKPIRPNRPVILLLGLILGLGTGIGTVALKEASDNSARRAEDLTKAFPFPVLAEIPELITKEDEQLRRKRLIAIVGTAAVCMVIIVLVIHFFVIDMDVLWARIARRLI